MSAQGMLYNGKVLVGKRTEVGAKNAAVHTSARSTQDNGTLRESATAEQCLQIAGTSFSRSASGNGMSSAAAKAARISVSVNLRPAPRIWAAREGTSAVGTRTSLCMEIVAPAKASGNRTAA